MIGGRVEKGKLDLMAKRAKARAYVAADMRALSDEVQDYAMNTYRVQMWDHQGRVPGRYGEGTSTWAHNAPATVTKKGFDKALHSSRQRHASSIFRNYSFRSWYQTYNKTGRASARWRFESSSMRGGFDYAKALHRGSGHYPARPHQGWTRGLQKAVVKIATDLALLRRGWRGIA